MPAPTMEASVNKHLLTHAQRACFGGSYPLISLNCTRYRVLGAIQMKVLLSTICFSFMILSFGQKANNKGILDTVTVVGFDTLKGGFENHRIRNSKFEQLFFVAPLYGETHYVKSISGEFNFGKRSGKWEFWNVYKQDWCVPMWVVKTNYYYSDSSRSDYGRWIIRVWNQDSSEYKLRYYHDASQIVVVCKSGECYLEAKSIPQIKGVFERNKLFIVESMMSNYEHPNSFYHEILN